MNKLFDLYPNGILCWVGDNEIELKFKEKLAIIIDIDEKLTRSFLDKSGKWWLLALPVTKQEIKELIYENNKSE